MAEPSVSREANPGIALAIVLVVGVTGAGSFALSRLVHAPATPATSRAGRGSDSPAAMAPTLSADELAALEACDAAQARVERWPTPRVKAQRLGAALAALPPAVLRSAALAPAFDAAARLERRAGDADAAQRLRAQADAADPDPLRVGLRAANGDLEALRRFASASFDATWPAATATLLATLLAEIDEADAALRVLERVVDTVPDDYELRVVAAELLLDQGAAANGRAREWLAGALALRPAAKRALFLELHLLLASDRASDAIALMQAAERRLPASADVALGLGFALLRGRYFDEARGRFEQALKLDPGLARAAAAIGSSWLEEGDYYRAIAACQRALEIADDPVARDEMARAYLESGNRERADALLDASIALHPDHPSLRDHHSASLAARGRFAEAIAGLREALRSAPYEAEIVNDLAWELANSGDPSLRRPGQALTLAQRACALDPESAWYRNTLGVAWYRLGDFDQALAVLEIVLEMPRGGGPLDHLFLAMTRQQLGDPAGALRHFESAEAVVERRDAEYLRLHAEAAALLGIEVPHPPMKDEAGGEKRDE